MQLFVDIHIQILHCLDQAQCFVPQNLYSGQLRSRVLLVGSRYLLLQGLQTDRIKIVTNLIFDTGSFCVFLIQISAVFLIWKFFRPTEKICRCAPHLISGSPKVICSSVVCLSLRNISSFLLLSVPESNPGCYIALSCHLSLVFSDS